MIGVIVNVLAVALGGVLGTVFSKKLSTRFTTELNKVFGVYAIGMGISSVPLMQNMPAATGCRIAKMQDFPVADMIPTMVLVMPLSALWTNYIAPLL